MCGFQQLARELLSDLREVEHNFRLLDRKVREKIALWEGCKLFCWGDIDTHGFAILDQLRGCFPGVVSFLMDRETLLRG